jgi:teichuronic acid biosynthesis glycosyltransferase TuaH
MSAEPRAHICLLSTADWNAPLWTNKQYMARELGVAHDVLYVESIGLRRPRLDLADLRRIIDRLKPTQSIERPLEPGVTVAKPRTVPLHNRATRRLNEHLLERTVSTWIADTDQQRVLWTYSPLTYGLERHADHVVYHCVDLLGAYPGVSKDLIERSEQALAHGAVTAIASSGVVREHLEDMGFSDVIDWPNVADTEPFRADPTGRIAGRVVFGGNVTPYKVDLELVQRIAREVENVDLVLAGPVDEGGAGVWSDPERLRDLGVTLTGTLTLDELADLYATATVGVIPYLINEYTRGVNPLKLYEYLASGLAVVSTPVPSVIELDLDPLDLRVEADPASFVDAVRELIPIPRQERLNFRRKVADKNSWSRRGVDARTMIDEMSRR